MEERPFTVLTPDFQSLDFSDQGIVSDYFSEQHPSLALILCDPNVVSEDGVLPIPFVSSIVSECQERNIPLIGMSSHRVFGRQACVSAIRESVSPTPAIEEVDAQSWLKYEELISVVSDHILVRSSWLLDGGETSLLRLLGEPLLDINVVSLAASDKAKISPVTQATLLNTLVALIHQILCGAENWGVFHLASADAGTELEVMSRLRERLCGDNDGDQSSLASSEGTAGFGGAGFLKGERLTLDFGVQLSSWRSGFTALVEREFQ